MNTESRKLNKWKDSFLKELVTKESVIVSGNVLDICQDTDDNNRYNRVTENIQNLVKSAGFKNIYIWDGNKTVTVQGNKLEIPAPVAGNNSGSAGEPPLASDSAFAGMFGDATGEPIGGESVDGFFTSMLTILKAANTDSTVFILDYSDYIFGNATALSEKERDYLVRISMALQAQKYDIEVGDYFKSQGNKVVIIAKNSSTIPPIYYQNNPMVSMVNIPDPGLPEREAFVKEILPALKVSNPLDSDGAKMDLENFIAALDGSKLKEIAQLAKLSKKNSETLTWSKLLTLFKYGEKVSPWEELDRERLGTLTNALSLRVKGQDEAIEKVRRVITRAFTGFSGLQHSAKQNKPKGTLFFVGPTGVGKTELAKAIAEFIFGDENACIRFDMSEYAQEQSDQKLIGAPPGYVGYEAGGELTNKVREKPFCVLLFDEIEKAHKRILDKFLQILEDGRLTDGKGDTVSFSETIIIFTSNIGAGSADISPEDDKFTVAEKFQNAVRKHFVVDLNRPELLNRIGNNIVPFNFINDPDVFAQIAKTKVTPLVNMMKEKYRATLKFMDEAKAFEIIARKANVKNGGRGVLNVIETEISDPLADFVFENMTDLQGRTVVIKVANEKLGRFNVEFE